MRCRAPNLLEEWQILHRSECEHVQQIRPELVHVAKVHLQVRLALAISLQQLQLNNVSPNGSTKREQVDGDRFSAGEQDFKTNVDIVRNSDTAVLL